MKLSSTSAGILTGMAHRAATQRLALGH